MSYQTDVFEAVKANTDFRRVLYTTDLCQLVLMNVLPGEDIGMEVHDLDQVLIFTHGQGKAILDGVETVFGPGSVTVVPAHCQHNFINVGTEPLKVISVYTPPEHPAGTVHRTRAESEAAHAAEHAAEEAAKVHGAFTVGSLRSR